MTSERVYEKLVRDKIPEIIRKSGEEPVTRRLADEEYLPALHKTLQEELDEYLKAETPEEALAELGDLWEVLRAAAAARGFSEEELLQAAAGKREARGSFGGRVYLVKVMESGS